MADFSWVGSGGGWGSKFCMKGSPSCLGLCSLSGLTRTFALLSPSPLGLPGFLHSLNVSLYPLLRVCLSPVVSRGSLTPLSLPQSLRVP